MEERDDAAANITQKEASEQRKRKKKNDDNNSSSRSSCKDKKRFSDEQIKLLESIFETETKLEPKKKLQVSSELGLQPRQVAIWFQNRRARWKSKMMEEEYRLLRASYDNLASRVEMLKIEKESLLLQLQKLSQLLGKPLEGSTAARSGNNVNIALAVEDNKKFDREPEAQPEVDKRAAAMCPHNERSRDVGSSRDEGRQFHDNYGSDHQCEGGGSIASFAQRWYGGLESGQAQLDNLPCTSSQWFDS